MMVVMVKSNDQIKWPNQTNGQNIHKKFISKCLAHLNNLKEGPIAQNIQDTLLKQLKKLENLNLKKSKKAMAFLPNFPLGWPFGQQIFTKF